MRPRLDKITLRGFKTIRELKDFVPGSLTVLIGPNGAGKSNFISFFRLLSQALTFPGELQENVAKLGGASSLLHDGPALTPQIEAQLRVVHPAEENEYYFRLAYAAGDTLIFTEEKYRYSRAGPVTQAEWVSLGAGHREAELLTKVAEGYGGALTIGSVFGRAAVYQFQNTSDTARIRQKWPIEDSRQLKEDAGNLGPILFRLRSQHPRYYQRIVETIRLILPFFADFELQPEYDRLLVQWREKGTDRVFSTGQAADGMLRVVALVTLLQQPASELPGLLILDEPELGLHPYAIEIIAALIRSASENVQVILATQSVSLIDRFNPEDIVVVNRSGRESSFQRLGKDDLKEWLDAYSLSELWEKNVIGGRP